MKIGILTYHCVPNFGAQLQTISTVGYLKRSGHTPIVLHWYPYILEDNYIKRIPRIQLECHKQFTEEKLPISRILRTQEDLVNEIQELGIEFVLSGSDALFKYDPKSTQWHFSKRKLKLSHSKSYTAIPISENPFFGGFLSSFENKIEASAFSVSSQNSQYTKMNQEEREIMAKCLANYKTITVRDEWTKMMVKDITGREEISLSPDPVFSFEQNRWFELPTKQELMQKYNIPANYILFSFSKHFQTEEFVKRLENAFSIAGYTPVALPMPEGCFDYKMSHKIDLPLSPIDWYALIKYSMGYVGERMHPIVVSIHNSVPFFCFDEYGTTKSSFFNLKKKYIVESSKTYHIIKEAGFESNMCSYRIGTIPTPNEIVAAIQKFDKHKCSVFSTSYQMYYESVMNKFF